MKEEINVSDIGHAIIALDQAKKKMETKEHEVDSQIAHLIELKQFYRDRVEALEKQIGNVLEARKYYYWYSK